MRVEGVKEPEGETFPPPTNETKISTNHRRNKSFFSPAGFRHRARNIVETIREIHFAQDSYSLWCLNMNGMKQHTNKKNCWAKHKNWEKQHEKPEDGRELVCRGAGHPASMWANCERRWMKKKVLSLCPQRCSHKQHFTIQNKISMRSHMAVLIGTDKIGRRKIRQK